MDQEQRAFVEELAKQHSEKLAQVAFRLTGSEELLLDMAQQTLLTACFRIDKVFHHPNPAGWLFKTLRNLIRREKEKAQNTEQPIPSEESLISSPDIDLPMSCYLPEGLTEEERNLILKHEEGYTFAEIAEFLGITQAACRKRYSRVLEKCRKLFTLDDIF